MLNNIIYSIFLFILIPVISFGSDTDLDIPLKEDVKDVGTLLKMIIEAMLDIAIPIIVLAIVYVGFLFIKAQGNDGELTKAKEALTWVLIGTAVIIGSNALYHIFFAAIK